MKLETGCRIRIRKLLSIELNLDAIVLRGDVKLWIHSPPQVEAITAYNGTMEPLERDVDLVALPPSNGSLWATEQLLVRVEAWRGLLRVLEAGSGDQHPLYVGSVLGVARWLLECGFGPVAKPVGEEAMG